MQQKDPEQNPATNNPAIAGLPAMEGASAELDPAIRQQVTLLAAEIPIALTMVGSFIPRIEILRKLVDISAKNLSLASTFEPVLEQFGKDPEMTMFYARLADRRSSALLNLVQVLKDTEIERVAFDKKRKES